VNTRKPLSMSVALALGTMMVGFSTSSSLAQVPDPQPNTFVDVAVPALLGWNLINARTVLDPEDPESGRTYIYPNATARNLDSAGDGTGSVAFVAWELDDASGRPPGIQAVTNDAEFPVRNCIMASGERLDEETGEIVPKVCSDDPSSSKRFFLEITEAGKPIDLVFATGTELIRYKGVKDPVDDGGSSLEEFAAEFGIGRIYRVIKKLVNDTDERLLGFSLEMGTGVGDEFQRFDFATQGVAFELREQVDRQFFDGRTGAGARDVWNPNRFATQSPKLFDDGVRPRFDLGFFDGNPAGLFPPQNVGDGIKSSLIDSGSSIDGLGRRGAITPNYFDMVNNQAFGAGIPGNPFGYWLSDSLGPTVIDEHSDGDAETEGDVVLAWWDGADWRYGQQQGFAVVPDDQLAQWAALPLGLDLDDANVGPGPARYAADVSDDLAAMNVDSFIYLDAQSFLDANGDPKFDTITLRITTQTVAMGTLGSEDPMWIGSPAPELSSYAPRTGIPVAINNSVTTRGREPVTIAILLNDFLDGQPIPGNAEIEVTAPENGVVLINADQTVTYTADPGFIGTDSFRYQITANGEKSNRATVSVRVLEPLVQPVDLEVRSLRIQTRGTTATTVDLLAQGSLNGDRLPENANLIIRKGAANGSLTINPNNTVTYVASAGFIGIDTVEFAVAVEDTVSNDATLTIDVLEPLALDPDPVDPSNPTIPVTPGTSSGGGCTIGEPGRFDPVLPGIILAALGWLGLRRIRGERS
jgi:hypothetical protein